MKSLTGFPLLLKSVTLNDLERRNAVILCCFTEFGSFRPNYVTVVEVTMSFAGAKLTQKKVALK